MMEGGLHSEEVPLLVPDGAHHVLDAIRDRGNDWASIRTEPRVRLGFTHHEATEPIEHGISATSGPNCDAT
ncbi:MAG: hypothetical protein JWN04_1801 [Myxococcaceae bacterium]|nr:hypothetical protein [Myxococcaceae bacterium]